MQYRFLTADVFTDQPFGGNPLAVFPDAEGLTADQMQRIAREFNFSETTFVLPPEDSRNTCRVRIFTPGEEVPFAGHPTVGTAFVLAHIGAVERSGDTAAVVFEEGVGPVPVTIHFDGEGIGFVQFAAAQAPEFGPAVAPSIEEIAAAVSLVPGDILNEPGGLHPQSVSCGLPFLFVPVRDREAIGRARPVRDRWEPLNGSDWTRFPYLFCRDAEREDADFRSRMFAPTVGVEEDPATGSAAAAFAGYLGVRSGRDNATLTWTVEQGIEMGRPSLIGIEADKSGGSVTGVRVGGRSVLMTEGVFHISS